MIPNLARPPLPPSVPSPGPRPPSLNTHLPVSPMSSAIISPLDPSNPSSLRNPCSLSAALGSSSRSAQLAGTIRSRADNNRPGPSFVPVLANPSPVLLHDPTLPPLEPASQNFHFHAAAHTASPPSPAPPGVNPVLSPPGHTGAPLLASALSNLNPSGPSNQGYFDLNPISLLHRPPPQHPLPSPRSSLATRLHSPSSALTSPTASRGQSSRVLDCHGAIPGGGGPSASPLHAPHSHPLLSELDHTFHEFKSAVFDQQHRPAQAQDTKLHLVNLLDQAIKIGHPSPSQGLSLVSRNSGLHSDPHQQAQTFPSVYINKQPSPSTPSSPSAPKFSPATLISPQNSHQHASPQSQQSKATNVDKKRSRESLMSEDFGYHSKALRSVQGPKPSAGVVSRRASLVTTKQPTDDINSLCLQEMMSPGAGDLDKAFSSHQGGLHSYGNLPSPSSPSSLFPGGNCPVIPVVQGCPNFAAALSGPVDFRLTSPLTTPAASTSVQNPHPASKALVCNPVHLANVDSSRFAAPTLCAPVEQAPDQRMMQGEGVRSNQGIHEESSEAVSPVLPHASCQHAPSGAKNPQLAPDNPDSEVLTPQPSLHSSYSSTSSAEKTEGTVPASIFHAAHDASDGCCFEGPTDVTTSADRVCHVAEPRYALPDALQSSLGLPGEKVLVDYLKASDQQGYPSGATSMDVDREYSQQLPAVPLPDSQLSSAAPPLGENVLGRPGPNHPVIGDRVVSSTDSTSPADQETTSSECGGHLPANNGPDDHATEEATENELSQKRLCSHDVVGHERPPNATFSSGSNGPQTSIPTRVPSPPVNKQMGAASAGVSKELAAQFEPIFTNWLSRLCSDLDMKDSKGEMIHQTLMARKMQRLEESMDFRPFKFRIQAFTNSFFEELVKCGFNEKDLPMKKVRQYLWSQSCISRFNEEGKKAKSKGNHVWHIEAQKIMNGQWNFLHFQRKIIGHPPPDAYVNVKWSWSAKVWDPQCSAHNIKAVFTAANLPPWLSWKNNVLSGTPSSSDLGNVYEVLVMATTSHNLRKYTLDFTFRLTVKSRQGSDQSRRDHEHQMAAIGASDRHGRSRVELASAEASALQDGPPDYRRYEAPLPSLSRTDSGESVPTTVGDSIDEDTLPGVIAMPQWPLQSMPSLSVTSTPQVEVQAPGNHELGIGFDHHVPKLEDMNRSSDAAALTAGVVHPKPSGVQNGFNLELRHELVGDALSAVGVSARTEDKSIAASHSDTPEGARVCGSDAEAGGEAVLMPSRGVIGGSAVGLLSGHYAVPQRPGERDGRPSGMASCPSMVALGGEGGVDKHPLGVRDMHEARLQKIRQDLMSMNLELSGSTGSLIRKAIESSDPRDRQFAAEVLAPMKGGCLVADPAVSSTRT